MSFALSNIQDHTIQCQTFSLPHISDQERWRTRAPIQRCKRANYIVHVTLMLNGLRASRSVGIASLNCLCSDMIVLGYGDRFHDPVDVVPDSW